MYTPRPRIATTYPRTYLDFKFFFQEKLRRPPTIVSRRPNGESRSKLPASRGAFKRCRQAEAGKVAFEKWLTEEDRRATKWRKSKEKKSLYKRAHSGWPETEGLQ